MGELPGFTVGDSIHLTYDGEPYGTATVIDPSPERHIAIAFEDEGPDLEQIVRLWILPRRCLDGQDANEAHVEDCIEARVVEAAA